MVASHWTDRYKRCPKCQARLLRTAEFCRQCGVHMPRSFSEKPAARDEMREAMQQKAQEAPAPEPRQGPFEITGRYLVIVASEQGELYTYLKAAFADERGVQVFQERRVADRRRKPGALPLDRRRRDRRVPRAGQAELRKYGVAVVRTI
jgi:ribosomal protein L40E